MSTFAIISIAVFCSVAALIGAALVIARDLRKTKAEDRLQELTETRTGDCEALALLKQDDRPDWGATLLERLHHRLLQFGNVALIFEQADSPITPPTFLLITAASAFAGFVFAVLARASAPLYPLAALLAGAGPLIWLLARRRARFKRFACQLPEALDLLSRALRAGHSLQAAMHVVADEMLPPISTEFERFRHAQTVGAPVEQALGDMVRRIPNPDLQFFATCVGMQRQSGGNLAEILNNISYIVRERFKILGQVQALTGEGRISGTVLMVLPILLFFTVYHLSPDYVMLLFTDTLGRKMLAVAAVLQLVGAFAIKKIVDIKV